MTAAQAAPDGDPTPLADRPRDRTPSPFDLRVHEIGDSRGQGAGPLALWTAHDVPTQEYL